MLQHIFATAAWAPTHRMKEPWAIQIVQGEAKRHYADQVADSYVREGLADGYAEDKKDRMMEGIKQFLIDIPHHAIVYMEKDTDQRKYEEDYAAVCAYIQNVQLVSWDAGVGVLWTSNPYIYDPEFVEARGLDPDMHKIVAVLQMGYPNRIPNARARTPIIKKLRFMD